MEDRSQQVLAIAVTFMVMCWVTVGLRVYCRLHVVKSFGADDLSLVILQFIFTLYLISQLLGWQYGTGQHKSALSEADNSQALMFWFACELLYIACTCLLKIAAGTFLARLAADARHVWVLRALMLSTALFGTAYFFLALFQCRPPRTFWEASPRGAGPVGGGGRCWSDLVVLAVTYAASVVNCLADWCFGLMPVLVVRTLNMPRGTRILVACLLSFAAIASIATIIRMMYIPTLLDGEDFLFRTTDVAIWSTVEVGIGIAALSLAALQPLLHHWRRRRPLGLLAPSSSSASASTTFPNTPGSSRSPLRGGRRGYYMHANSHDRQGRRRRQQQRNNLKLRPGEEPLQHISSASSPPPPPPTPKPSRFAISSWIEEGGNGGGGGGGLRGGSSSSMSSRSGRSYYRRRSNASTTMTTMTTTTELADWSGGVSSGDSSSGIIIRTTEMSQSLHRVDSLPDMGGGALVQPKRALEECTSM